MIWAGIFAIAVNYSHLSKAEAVRQTYYETLEHQCQVANVSNRIGGSSGPSPSDDPSGRNRLPDAKTSAPTPATHPASPLDALRRESRSSETDTTTNARRATFRATRSPESAFIPVSYSARSNAVIAQSLDSSNIDIALYHDTSSRFDECAVIEVRSQGAYTAQPAQLSKVIVDAVNAYGLHPGNGFAVINGNSSISEKPGALKSAVNDALASLGYRELRASAVRMPHPITHDETDGLHVKGAAPLAPDTTRTVNKPRTVMHGHQMLWKKLPDILFAAHGQLPKGQAGDEFHVPRDTYLVRGATHADGHVMSAHEILYRVVSSGDYRHGQELAFYAEPRGSLTQEHIDRLAEDIADVAQVPLTHIRDARAQRSPGPPGAAFEVVADSYARSITPESDLRRPSTNGLGVLENFGKEKVAFKGAAVDSQWGEPVVVTIQRTPNGSSFIRSPDQIIEAKRQIQALGYPVERIRRADDIFGRPAWIAEGQAVIFDSKSNYREGSMQSPTLNEQTLAHLRYIRTLAAKSGNELVDAQIGIRRDGAAVLRDTGLASLTGVHGSGRGVDALLDTVEAETRLSIAQRGETSPKNES